MDTQYKGKRGTSKTSGSIDGIRRKDLPSEADSKRMSEWLRKRGEMSPFLGRKRKGK